MRRRARPEPISRLAVWSLRFVLFGMTVAATSVFIARADWLDGLQAIIALLSGLALVGLGLIVALIAGAIIWVTGMRGTGHAVVALLLAAIVLAYPATYAVNAFRIPALNDVTTDMADPPAFDIAASVRSANANPTAYRPELAAIQRAAYPEIRPLDVDLPPDDVMEIVTDLAENHRWRILDQVDYTGPAREGRVEMVTRSTIMGFRDDMVIRVRFVNGRARIDMRSASRFGRHDFGANARRVIGAMEELRAASRRVQR